MSVRKRHNLLQRVVAVYLLQSFKHFFMIAENRCLMVDHYGFELPHTQFKKIGRLRIRLVRIIRKKTEPGLYIKIIF